MPAVHIVTGTPFSVTFVNGTNTFTIPGNFTSVFVAQQILTVLGGSPNGGYQSVSSSSFDGTNTTVTVSSYSTGTSYPGPATFTIGTGTVILTNDVVVAPPTVFQFNVGGPQSTGPIQSRVYTGDGTGFFDGSTNGGFTAGSTTPSPAFLNGNQINAVAWQGGTGFVFVVNATLAQNAFTTLAVGAPVNYSLPSSTATFDFNSFPGYSVWIWSGLQSDEYTYLGANPTVTIT